MTAIKRNVFIQDNGVLELRDPELRAGENVEVVVLIKTVTQAVTADKPRPSWRDFIGCFEGGDPHGSANESIDRDLAASYLDKHEPE